MKILCITDIHGHNKKLSHVLNKESDSDLIILAGDITQLGGYKQAGEILKPLLESRIKIMAVHGNMDRRGVIDYLEEKGLSIHGRCVLEKNMIFLGIGGSNPTPFHTPHEYTDMEVNHILEYCLTRLNPNCTNSKVPIIRDAGDKRKIFISHTPPVNTALDVVTSGAHVGSGLIREIISSYNIDLCICGHIHESAGTDKIGESMCVNPGAFRDGNYAIVDITDKCINIIRRLI